MATRARRKASKLWSVTRIRHPKHPDMLVRIGEFEAGGRLHCFRMINGKQRSRAIEPRRTRLDLGLDQKTQERAARAIAFDLIEQMVEEADRSPGDALAPITDDMTLGALADRYKRDGLVRVTSGHRRDAKAAVDRVVAAIGNDIAVKSLKPSQIEKYLAARVAEDHAPAGRRDLLMLKTAITWAIGEGYLTVHPMLSKRARDAMRIVHKPSRAVVTKERFQKLLAKADQLPPAFAVLLAVHWHTGHRHTAVLTLQWKAVDFTQSSDAPFGSITWYQGVRADHKKHEHCVPLNSEARAALLAWHEREVHRLRPKDAKVAGRIGKDEPLTGHIFRATHAFEQPGVEPKRSERRTRGREDVPLGKHVAKAWLLRAEAVAELPHMRQSAWHALRRGWATARKHMSLKDVAAAGGWTDTATLLTSYVHGTTEETKRVATFTA